MAVLGPVSRGATLPPMAPTEQGSPVSAAGGVSWDAFVSEYVAGYLASHPTFAVAAGRHEYDGQLPDWSLNGLGAEARRLESARRRARAWTDLDSKRSFERDYLLARIEGDLFWLNEVEAPLRNPMFYVDALDPSLYLSRDYAPVDVRRSAYATYLRNLPEAIAALSSNLRRPLPLTFADLAAQTLSGLADFCRQAPAAFSTLLAGRDAELSAPTADAIRALEEAAGRFRVEAQAGRERGPNEPSFRLGAAGLARMLWATERIDIPLTVLEGAARTELARNREALAAACADWIPGATPRECMAKLQAMKPSEGPVAGARQQLTELREFLRRQDLVSVPAEQTARVEEAPPHQRWNSAYIEIPGPFEQAVPAIYYIAPPDPEWSAEERAAYLPSEADLLFISAHEVWPGHFLQFLHSHRAASPIGRLFVGYGFAEGWAHYAEELIWEAGFRAGQPAIHLGQLLNALLRNVRLLVALGLHAGDLSLADAEQLFRDEAYQDAASARQQAARGTFDPGYLLYTLGKLLVRKLRQDWLAEHGPSTSLRTFHDALLTYGGPPLPLVRAAMLSRPSPAL
jgi:Bacterial protein of unknown function (DUF885)